MNSESPLLYDEFAQAGASFQDAERAKMWEERARKLGADPDVMVEHVYEFVQLGWLPIPNTGTTIRSVDLANIAGDNRLPFLQGGQLDIHITDDTAVDYATLTIEVIPEPATLSLLAIGGLALIRRRPTM